MISNTIKLSLGSLLLILIVSCVNEVKNNVAGVTKKAIPDSCRYYAYDAQRMVSNLSCYNCHVKGERLNDILSFNELAKMDSIKLVNFAFVKRHNGNYSLQGAFKTARMDTLTDCEIKSAIRYIKDFSRNITLHGK